MKAFLVLLPALAASVALASDPENGTATPNLVQNIQTPAALLAVDYSPDGKRLVTGGLGRDIVIWEAESAKQTMVLHGHTDDVVAVKFSPNGRYIASGGVDKALILWDAITGEILRKNTDHTDYVRDVAFSPDSKLVASAGWDGQAMVWETFSGVKVATLTGQKAGAVAATVAYEKNRTNKGRSSNMTSVAFNPSGTELLTASGDRTVRGWDTRTWQQKYVLNGHTDEVWDARFSPNGRFVVSGAWDNTARIWDVNTRQPIAVMPAHLSDVWGTTFSPDGQLVATCGGDRKVKVWDMATGILVRDLSGEAHKAEVETLVFSPDGQQLASVSRDGSLKIWRVPSTFDRVSAYAEHQLAKWEKKGDFEKSDEYQKRMTQKLKRWEEFKQEARTKMLAAFPHSADWQTFSLASYNPDTELYQVHSKLFAGPFFIKVAPRDAEQLRDNFSKVIYGTPAMELKNDDLLLKSVELIVPTGGSTKVFTVMR